MIIEDQASVTAAVVEAFVDPPIGVGEAVSC
jgi:hypothetical protein